MWIQNGLASTSLLYTYATVDEEYSEDLGGATNYNNKIRPTPPICKVLIEHLPISYVGDGHLTTDGSICTATVLDGFANRSSYLYNSAH